MRVLAALFRGALGDEGFDAVRARTTREANGLPGPWEVVLVSGLPATWSALLRRSPPERCALSQTARAPAGDPLRGEYTAPPPAISQRQPVLVGRRHASGVRVSLVATRGLAGGATVTRLDRSPPKSATRFTMQAARCVVRRQHMA
jgi:hypothetical protein